jgi:hypothetical protein
METALTPDWIQTQEDIEHIAKSNPIFSRNRLPIPMEGAQIRTAPPKVHSARPKDEATNPVTISHPVGKQLRSPHRPILHPCTMSI